MNKKVIIVIFIFIIAVIAIALNIKIENINIVGNTWYTSEQLEAEIFDGAWAKNSLYCFVHTLIEQKKDIPFVEDYNISFTDPSSVTITVYEKSIVGYVSYMSSYMYFDKDGIVVESASTKLNGIPLVTGLKFGNIGLHEKLPVEDDRIFDSILNLTQALSLYDVSVDQIFYNSSGNARLIIGDINVELGDSSNMSGKISTLSDMYEKIKDWSGTLYLDTFDPMDSDKEYTFQSK